MNLASMDNWALLSVIMWNVGLPRLSLNNIMVWNIKCKHWMSNIIAQNFKTFVNFSIRTFDSCRIFSFIFSFSIRSFSFILTAPPLTWACRHQMNFVVENVSACSTHPTFEASSALHCCSRTFTFCLWMFWYRAAAK